MLAERVALLEFEGIRQEYAVQDGRGIPMSVHDRYRNALAEMRFKIREARNSSAGKRLGELLAGQGVLDQKALQRGLAEQQQRGNGELLGEVLVSLNLIDEKALVATLNMQMSEN